MCNFTVPGRSIKNLLMKNQLLDSVVFCSSRGEIPDPVPEGVCAWNGKFSTLGAHLDECPHTTLCLDNLFFHLLGASRQEAQKEKRSLGLF
jgi:hypothetical protein